MSPQAHTHTHTHTHKAKLALSLSLPSYCEESLAEAVATLIWVAPRLSADVPELNEVCTCMSYIRICNFIL